MPRAIPVPIHSASCFHSLPAASMICSSSIAVLATVGCGILPLRLFFSANRIGVEAFHPASASGPSFRLTHPPLNLKADELLGAVVERCSKRYETRPTRMRLFFGLASQYMLWELNETARRLDN